MGKKRINESWYTSRTDEWSTPNDVYKALDSEFHFTLDPCASAENHKCERYYTVEENGLARDWGGANLFRKPTVFKDGPVVSQVSGGVTETKHDGSDADPSQDGYGLLP